MGRIEYRGSNWQRRLSLPTSGERWLPGERQEKIWSGQDLLKIIRVRNGPFLTFFKTSNKIKENRQWLRN